MIKRYIVHALPEFVLCLICAVSLSVNVVQSFRLTDEMYTSYLMFIVVTGVVLAALFFVGYDRKTMTAGIPILIVIAAVLVILCGRMGYSLIETDVFEDNWGVCYLVVVIIAALSWLSSRSQLGTMIFAAAGAVTHGWICLCLYGFSVKAMVVFLCAVIVLYLYTRYRHQILNVHSPGHAFPALMGTSVMVTVVALAAAAAVFFGILAPLNPPTLKLELIERVVSTEVLQKVGVSKDMVVMGDEYASQVDEDYDASSRDKNNQLQEDKTIDGDRDSMPEKESATEDIETERDESILTENEKVFSLLDHPVLLIILICAAAALVVLAVVRFLRRHSIWLSRLQSRDRGEQICQMYYLFRAKMKLMNISGMSCDTPVNYARRISGRTKILDEGGPSWLELSGIFSRFIYGRISPTEEEYHQYLEFYHKFWKGCRKICGFRYLWKQFRL